MAAAPVDLYVEQGTTLVKPLTWGTRGPDDVDGNPTLDTPYPLLTDGCTAIAQFRQGVGTPVILELTTENGGIALADTQPNILLTVTDEQSDLFELKKMKWDLKVIYPTGVDKRPFKGTVYVDMAITVEEP